MQMDSYATISLNYINIIGQGAPVGAMPKFLTDFLEETLMKIYANVTQLKMGSKRAGFWSI